MPAKRFCFVHTCGDNGVPNNVRKGISDPLILVDEEYIGSSQYGIQSKKLIYMQTYTKLIFFSTGEGTGTWRKWENSKPIY